MWSCRLALLLMSLLAGAIADLLSPPTCNYNLEEIVAQVNLQFCTIVEIGQSYCSMFLEFRSSPLTAELSSDNVAELYLGTCECSTIRNWELCSVPLKKARPYECSFEEALPMVNSSARVHRRLCDPTMMATMNEPCDCTKQLAQRTQYPVQGFLTCYKAPMPKSICSTHSVCGVARCAAKSLYGLALVQCDPNCKGRQPIMTANRYVRGKFCEDPSEVSSKPPIVTSIWSDWTPARRDSEGLQIDEAICLDETTNAPAFDCLGPGSYCCPKEYQNCKCEVTTTMAEMKVTRYIGLDHALGRRSFLDWRLNDLVKARDIIFGKKHNHMNYSWAYMNNPRSAKRIIYEMPINPEQNTEEGL